MKRLCAAMLALLLAVGASGNGGGGMMPSIEEVKARHERVLMQLPGVVLVGIGRDDQGRPVIVVGLDELRPETQAALPQALEGYPVRVEIVGPIKAL